MGKGRLSLLHHRSAVGQHHHLGQVADGDVLLTRHLSVGGFLHAGNDFQHGALARSVLAHEGDAVFGVDHETGIYEERCGGKFHTQFVNRNHLVCRR